MQKSISRFWAVAMCLMMMVVACATPSRVMAAEVSADSAEVVADTDSLNAGGTVSPNAVTYLVNKLSGDAWIGSNPFTVTPGSGKNLKLIANSPSCNVLVFVNGSYKMTIPAGGGSNTYNLVTNCGSGSYTVNLYQEAGALVFFAIASTDYV